MTLFTTVENKVKKLMKNTDLFQQFCVQFYSSIMKIGAPVTI